MQKVDEHNCQQKLEYSEDIVAYLLKARTVEAEKQLLLGNGPYTRNRRAHHLRCDITQQKKRCCKYRSLWVRAALVATQLCGKHITARVNQHSTIEEAVFSMGPPRDYITRISPAGIRVERVSGIGSWLNN
jgi:hypothetical protein